MADPARQTVADVLPRLRNRIQKIRTRKENVGEQNTKAALIDPLLSALGWDIEDIDEVSREYRRKPQDNPVDYALFMLRSPRLFVEAKGLEKDLSDRKWISQILGYATVVGVEWCILTNGDEYRLYNAHAPVDVEQKLFRAVRLSEADQDEYTLETLELLSKEKMGDNLLNVLWKAHFIDRHVSQALGELLQNDDTGLIRLIRKRTPELAPSEIRESLKRADIHIDFPVVSVSSRSAAREAEDEAVPTTEVVEKEERQQKTINIPGVQVVDLVRANVIQPPLKLEKQYKGQQLEAVIQQDGTILFDGETYRNLSPAAGFARKSIIGRPVGSKGYPPTNGWTFWKYHDPQTGRLEEIDVLRQRYLAGQSQD
jgi:Restriction Enzyme Adenine Methylase Associated/Type I restriction enzyme R protein N terminus (HSDR_N)